MNITKKKSDKLKLVYEGTEEYEMGKELQALFIKFHGRQDGLHKRLASAERMFQEIRSKESYLSPKCITARVETSGVLIHGALNPSERLMQDHYSMLMNGDFTAYSASKS